MNRERGFSLITAIFLIVVLAALAGYAVSLSTAQQESAALDEKSARTYQAAQSGLEWGMWQVLRSAPVAAACPVAAGNPPCPASPTVLAMPAAASSLTPFVVSVSCVARSYCEAGNNISIYTLTSTACGGPAAGGCPSGAPGDSYTERQVSVMVERCTTATGAAC